MTESRIGQIYFSKRIGINKIIHCQQKLVGQLKI